MKLKPDVLEKLGRFCSFRERSLSEVEDKLFKLGLSEAEQGAYLRHLLELDVVNEDRFTKAFVSGKFKVKAWGKFKIRMALKQKGIRSELIEKALLDIPMEEYLEVLKQLIEKKEKRIKVSDPYKRKASLMRYLQQKGFESDLIIEQLNKRI